MDGSEKPPLAKDDNVASTDAAQHVSSVITQAIIKI